MTGYSIFYLMHIIKNIPHGAEIRQKSKHNTLNR